MYQVITIKKTFTFNPRNQKLVHLVHHLYSEYLNQGILECAYKDRQMLYLDNMTALQTNKKRT
jgi:hypothetical protein